jgi:hypothetical protein
LVTDWRLVCFSHFWLTCLRTEQPGLCGACRFTGTSGSASGEKTTNGGPWCVAREAPPMAGKYFGPVIMVITGPLNQITSNLPAIARPLFGFLVGTLARFTICLCNTTAECQIKPHAATLKPGKWLKLNVAAPPVSQAFGHVESSRLVPRGAHSSPITIQQKHDQRYARVMVDLKASI